MSTSRFNKHFKKNNLQGNCISGGNENQGEIEKNIKEENKKVGGLEYPLAITLNPKTINSFLILQNQKTLELTKKAYYELKDEYPRTAIFTEREFKWAKETGVKQCKDREKFNEFFDSACRFKAMYDGHIVSFGDEVL